MARTSYRHSILTRVRPELRPGELVEGMFPAASEPGDGETPAGFLGRRRRDRALSRASLFPLTSRMVMALTNQRLMIWTAGLRWQPVRFLGYVSRDRILQVAAPGIVAGPRPVVIYLVNEPPVTIKVPSAAADRLVRGLSGEPSPGRS